MRGADAAFCAGCGFAGDLVELYAAVSKQPFGAAIADLKLSAGLHLSDVDEIRYLDERAQNHIAIALWRTAQKRIQDGITSSTKAIFQDLACYTTEAPLQKLWPVLGVLRGEDIPDYLIRKEDRGVVRRLGHYNALTMPVWEQSRLVGFWLIQPASALNRGHEFLQLAGDAPTHGLAGAQSLRIGQELAFFTNDPRVAVRYLARQAVDQDGFDPVPFCIPMGPYEPYEQLSTQRVVYLPIDGPDVNLIDWLKRPLRLRGVDTVEPWGLAFSLLTEFQRNATSQTMLNHLASKATPAPKALGNFLLRLKGAEAIRHIANLSLTTLDRNSILNHFQHDDVEALEHLLDRGPRTVSIEFDGKRIQEGVDGWTVDGKVICNAIIRFSEQIVNEQTGETTLIGTVAFDNRSIPFRALKSLMRKNLFDWLEALVGNHRGWLRTSPSWNTRLLDVAHAFSRDTMRMTVGAKSYGWGDKKTLFTRRFTVDRRGYTRVALNIGGPDLPIPKELTASEQDAFLDPGFCMMALALLGNLIRTANGVSGYGLLLSSSSHLVDRVADALNVPVEEDPAYARVIENARMPLPLAAQWSDDRLAGVLRQIGAKHMLASVDQLTYELLGADPAWLQLPISSIADYAALRWIWLVLPGLLDWVPPENAFYTALAQRLSEDLASKKYSRLLTSAASQLDARRVGGANTGTSVVRLLHRLVDLGRLKVVTVADGIRVVHADVRAAMTSPLLPAPDIRRMTDQLTEGSMLVGSQPGVWLVSGGIWSMVGSYSRAT